MKFILFIILFCFTFAQGQAIDGNSHKLEDGWNGIKLFKTSRSEIEKIYTNFEEGNGVTIYRTDNSVIFIYYSAAPCSQDKMRRGKYNLKPDTVIGFRMSFFKEPKLKDLNWTRNLYERFINTHQLGYFEYNYWKGGITITTIQTEKDEESIRSIMFLPTEELTSKFKCNSLK
jgi:hypothetical protein